jgi:hypothetical protein
MVDITLLTEQISNFNLHHNYVRWPSTYLRGKLAACIYQGSRSSFRCVYIGVPQGSVLSPCLFNFFTSDFRIVNGTKVSFADDFTLAFTPPDHQVIEATLNEDLRWVAKWAKRKRLMISRSKSQATLFMPDKEMYMKPQLLIEGCPIPVENRIKILGLTMDSLHTMMP